MGGAAVVGEGDIVPIIDVASLPADGSRGIPAVGELAERGWQVVYLTCDTHLRELFEGAGARVTEL